MTRTQISLEPRLYRAARAEARRRGISFAELCRRALAKELPVKKAENPWMKWSGILDSGDPNSSRTVNEVVYGREKP